MRVSNLRAFSTVKRLFRDRTRARISATTVERSIPIMLNKELERAILCNVGIVDPDLLDLPQPGAPATAVDDAECVVDDASVLR